MQQTTSRAKVPVPVVELFVLNYCHVHVPGIYDT